MTALCPGPVETEFTEAGGFKPKTRPVVHLVHGRGRGEGGIEGADNGKRVVIPGIANRVTANFGRHGPRSIVLGPFASAYRQTIGE